MLLMLHDKQGMVNIMKGNNEASLIYNEEGATHGAFRNAQKACHTQLS